MKNTQEQILQDLKKLFAESRQDDSFNYNGNRITISQSEHDESPREWCNLGKMWIDSKYGNLGDDRENFKNYGEIKELMEYEEYEELKKFLKKNNDVAVFIPLQIWSYSSSDIQLRVSTTDIDGFIYATRSDILETYQVKKLTKKIIERAEKCLLSELKTYNKYLNGEVYQYKIEKIKKCNLDCEHYEFKEGVSGFYCMDHLLGDLAGCI